MQLEDGVEYWRERFVPKRAALVEERPLLPKSGSSVLIAGLMALKNFFQAVAPSFYRVFWSEKRNLACQMACLNPRRRVNKVSAATGGCGAAALALGPG